MQTLSTVSPDELLQEACARNQPLEIFYTNKKDDDCQAKSRFIAIEPQRVLIERPTVGVRVAGIPSETIVTVHFCIQGRRWAFQSKVTGQRLYQLNAQKKVVVVQLRSPHKILLHQRRKDFRISLFSYDGLRVFLLPIDEQLSKNLRMICRKSAGLGLVSEQEPPSSGAAVAAEAEAQQEDDASLAEQEAVPVMEARMANLSVGGIALVLATVPGDVAPAVTVRDRLLAVFSLPGEEDIFRFPVEVRHVRRNEQTEISVIGCKFLIKDDSFDVRASIRRVARFLAFEQRRQLRRGADLK